MRRIKRSFVRVSLMAALALALPSCWMSGPGATLEPDQVDSPTPLPGPDIRTTTWSASFSTGIDPLVEGHTSLYMNTETVEDGRVTGWFWHAYGELSVDGIEVPPRECIKLTGTYDGSKLLLEGWLAGHVLRLDGDVTYPSLRAHTFLTLDDDLYIFETSFDITEYWPVTPY